MSPLFQIQVKLYSSSLNMMWIIDAYIQMIYDYKTKNGDPTPMNVLSAVESAM